ncbi:MAG: hypothetical protein SF172_08865 [Burkholderiales bacterium]|nr:hypothetical protein [Burkholderiales bacterium]
MTIPFDAASGLATGRAANTCGAAEWLLRVGSEGSEGTTIDPADRVDARDPVSGEFESRRQA